MDCAISTTVKDTPTSMEQDSQWVEGYCPIEVAPQIQHLSLGSYGISPNDIVRNAFDCSVTRNGKSFQSNIFANLHIGMYALYSRHVCSDLCNILHSLKILSVLFNLAVSLYDRC